MLERFTKIISIIFAIAWGIIIFIEYWQYNPIYKQAYEFFQYYDLFFLLLLLGAALSWGLAKARKKKKKINFINGLVIMACLLFIDIITLAFFYGKLDAQNLSSAGLFSHLGLYVGVAFCTYLVYLVCRVLGATTTTIFPIKIAQIDLPIIQTALGIMLLTFLIFALGAFHVLYLFIVAPLLVVILLLNWRETFRILKATLFRPIEVPEKLNALGIFSFLFLAVFITANFSQILRPLPMGTDSINLYVNLPTLIADYAGLVDGNQPYNWSLFMSLGLVGFGRIDVVLALSFLGGFLSLFALFRLGRKWLDVNYAAFCLLLFFSAPMINFLSFMDMKIDLGLLYISLCTLILFVNWVLPPDLSGPLKKTIKQKPSKNKKGKKQANAKKAAQSNYLSKVKIFCEKRLPSILINNRLIVLMGIFAGFALGIKLTSLFVFFALMAAIWYVEGGIWAFLSAFFLTIGTTLLLGLDEEAQLRHLHLNVSTIQWALLAAGLALVIYLIWAERKMMLRLVKLSLVISGFFILPMLPWLGKNWLETKSFSTYNLLNGKQATPEINIGKLEEKWKEVYE